MFYPKLFNDDIFDDFFDFPRFRMPAEAEHKLYGKHASGLMKTDIRDKDGNYELDIDLPGFKKDGQTAPSGTLFRRYAEKLLCWRRH